MKRLLTGLIMLLALASGVTACAGTATPTAGNGGTTGSGPTEEPTIVAAEATPMPTNAPAPTDLPTVVAVNTTGAQPTAAPSDLPEGVIMVFKREGGIAGFCDNMTVTLSLVTLESCNPNFPHGEMPLDPAVRARLLAIQEQYASFTTSESDAPGAADAMTFTIDFAGTGADPLTPAAQDELMQIGQTLLDSFASES